jgi:pimeloyl-ACP methyl ester carboxylesterase
MGVISHRDEVRHCYARVLAGATVRRRYVEVGTGHRVHVLEQGTGPAAVLLPGSGSFAGFFLPLLDELKGVAALAPDRPGQGLSDPIDLSPRRFRETAVAWLDRLLDALDLDTAVLLGHSGGAVLALWYALAHPERVKQLVLVDPPAFPKTRCPLPLRMVATPLLGELLSRLVPPTPKSLLRLASFMGEGATLAAHPDLIDLWVATSRDPVADRAARAELRALISPFALLSRSGWRRRSRVRLDELRQVAIPTLMVWGEQDPLVSVSGARAVTELIPRAQPKVLAGGHMPWLGQPDQAAALAAAFVLANEGSER